MTTSTCIDESSVDCLVLCHNKQDMKVSTKSVTSEYMCNIPIVVFMSEIKFNLTLKKSNFLFLLCFYLQ